HWNFVRESCKPVLLAALCFVATPLPASADEGMWLFNQPPRKQLKEKYGFDPSDSWLEHLQKSAVRFNSGGSGSFVSAGGLVMTNHHVGADCLQKLSTSDKDLVKIGFYAHTRDEEIKCVDLELNVLANIEDVTERVNASVKPGMDAAAAQQARRAVRNTIEKESYDKTGLRSDVVTLFQGGRYNLYRYKKYTDVRLVFAPEKDIAFFGGDPDNFEYPRYDLDICFFRVYENGKPFAPEHYLRWSKAGAIEDELVFVAGHPGRTDRLNTVAHLDFLRDRVFPTSLNLIRRREVLLKTYSDRGLENARRAQDDLFGYQNTRKARLGGLAGLQDPAIMEAKRKAERGLRQAVANDPKLRDARDAWDEVNAALAAWTQIYADYDLYERGMAFYSDLFHIARMLVRLADETAKPNPDRLREYAEAGLDSLKQQLFSEAPIYPDLETVKLSDSLGYLMERAGAENPFVIQILANSSPAQRAAQLISGSKLADVSVRKHLAESGKSAIESSDDPLIALARLVDGPARKVRKTYEDKVEEPLRQAYAKVARARFAVEGENTYPDATFTLRLAFGQVKGYEEQGMKLPSWTTIGGSYKHAADHGNVPPFELPPRWQKDKDRLALDTPFNFVSTADIIGGNSGSPVVNRENELVGIIFDGNIQSLVLDFAYTDHVARAISVHSSSIVEALQKIYAANDLADELTGKN
ncbi:MAG TPA: S46 family peptidase, partial [Pirellulales bacterium]|nr:S46 family peptidase [Pirellulales bacterium]